MKYGIYYAYWEDQWDGNFLKYVEKVGNLGFDILEINGGPLGAYSKEDIRKLKACANEHGVELTAGYGPIYDHDMGTSDVTKRESVIEWYKKMFTTMEALNMKALGGAIYSHWPIDYNQGVDKEEDWKHSVEGMQILGDIAKDYNITLGMEVLNRFENHILNTAEEGVKFISEVGKSNVKVMLDTFHMNIEEDNLRNAIITAKDCLGHFHLGECNRKVPGKGRIPWQEVMATLIEIGYDGRMVMEPFVRSGGQVGKDIKIWRNVERDTSELRMDEDVKHSLQYLKSLEKMLKNR